MIMSNLHSADQDKVTNTVQDIDSNNSTKATSNQSKGGYSKDTTVAKKKYIDLTIITFYNEVTAYYSSEKKKYKLWYLLQG